jgi:hypothetical protein
MIILFSRALPFFPIQRFEITAGSGPTQFIVNSGDPDSPSSKFLWTLADQRSTG